MVLLLVRRPAGHGGEALAALSGKLDALGAAQDRQAAVSGERLASQERLLADRFAEARAATDAALASQRERLLAQEQALADRLGETTRMLTEAMTTALSAQNTRLAQQEQALADRLAATQEALAGAVAAQNDRLGRVLSESAVKAEETAGKIHERLAVIDAARANMEALGAQVGSLAQILGNKQARGAFGEVQLRQLIEDRLPADGFVWQHTLSNKTRCDCLIRLPHPPGPIAVDSKFPLEAWLAARDAADDAARLAATKRFASDIGRHIEDVAGKYICPGETAEGALIFVPSEAIYADLHAVHPGVVEAAARRGIYIVSPSTHVGGARHHAGADAGRADARRGGHDQAAGRRAGAGRAPPRRPGGEAEEALRRHAERRVPDRDQLRQDRPPRRADRGGGAVRPAGPAGAARARAAPVVPLRAG